MKKYIGCRMFEVEPMTRGDYNAYRGWSVPADENPLDEGYLTKDPDGHVSWLPKNTFEKAYMKLEDNPMLPSGVSIGQKMVDEFIAYTETKTMGTKTTVVRCVLRNGFEIVESTGCVDEKNYSEKKSGTKSVWNESKIKSGNFWAFCFRWRGMESSREERVRWIN